MINIKTTNITKEAAKKRLFDEVAAVFDDAWAQQKKWCVETQS